MMQLKKPVKSGSLSLITSAFSSIKVEDMYGNREKRIYMRTAYLSGVT